MPGKLIFLLVSLTLLACRAGYQPKPSNLYVNGTKHNRFIVDRKLTYGDGLPNGCIVLAEMNVSLKSVTGLVEGIITDLHSNSPLSNASINIKADSAQQQKQINLISDAEGRFKFHKTGKVTEIKIQAPGYRILHVHFRAHDLL